MYVLTGVGNLRIKLWKSKQLIKTEEERKSKEKILLHWRLHKVISCAKITALAAARQTASLIEVLI
jgi:hypothetical protein